jgi:hypothetical protein
LNVELENVEVSREGIYFTSLGNEVISEEFIDTYNKLDEDVIVESIILNYENVKMIYIDSNGDEFERGKIDLGMELEGDD